MNTTSIDVQQMQKNAGEAATLLKSLAHPSRLLVLCALVNREHTAGELEELTGLSQSAISQHLARLRHSGIVSTRRDAQWITYSLCCPQVRQLIGALHTLYCPDNF